MLANFSDHTDLNPFNIWYIDKETKIILNLENKEVYTWKPTYFIRLKGACAFLATPFIHSIGVVVNVAWRILCVINLPALWGKRGIEKEIANKKWVEDIKRIGFAPFLLPSLMLASLYIIVSPYNGQRVYAHIERLFYGKEIYPEPACFYLLSSTLHFFPQDRLKFLQTSDLRASALLKISKDLSTTTS